MAMTPEFGEEERMNQQEGRVKRRSEGIGEPDHETEEHKRGERESVHLEPEGNEAHAPGEACERCRAVITASQNVRRLPDGNWVHEVCPPQDLKTST